jgi:predicted transglutaminase-like cysteine proteinase
MIRRQAFPAGRLYSTAIGAIVLGGLLFATGITNGEAATGKVFRQGSAAVAANNLDLDMTTTSTVTSGLFGSVAFPFKPGALRRWKQIETAAGGLSSSDCGEQATCRTRLKMLRETVDATSNEPLLRKIEALNVSVNRLVRYSKDADAHGQLDYWAMPAEILASGKGDCEDYAILKLAALRQAGIEADSMTLVVLREARRNFYHAVLTVTVAGKNYVLDNMRDAVLTDRQLPDYQALYSLGTERAWIHGYKRGSEFAQQKRPTSLDAVQPGEGIPVTF